MKNCRVCGLEKPLTDFYRHKNSKDGYQGYCKTCHTASNAEWAKRNPSAKAAMYKRHSLKKKYGMSEEGFQSLIEHQKGRCAICNSVFDESCKNGINVDHNHDTGAVRGLLCNACNTGIGLLKDSPSVLEAAIAYLRTKGSYERSDTRSTQAAS